MPAFELPQAQSPKELLDKLVHEIQAMAEQVQKRSQAVDEILTLSADSSEIETSIEAAKRTMFLLLHERFHRSQAEHVERYCKRINDEISTIEARMAKKEKDKK